jgi:hypothetical protein
MSDHTITLARDPRGGSYCAACGRSVWPARTGGSLAVGVWPTGTVATFASHTRTGAAVIARRLAYLAPRAAECWPFPCRDYHDTEAHRLGFDPCACACHHLTPGGAR